MPKNYWIGSIKSFSCICCAIFVVGCFTTNKTNWHKPPKPSFKEVEFKMTNINGETYFTMTEDGAKSLLTNLDRYDAYIEKLELLIDEMEEYYR